MGIVAAFDKVLFYNPASKYSVLRLKTADLMIPDEARSPYHYRDHLIRFVAVGYDLPQTEAIKMELTGVWEKGRYGCQLQVEQWHEIVPPTLEGICGYLSSGLLKGIGEKTAEAIVQRFGVDSLNVLENQPNRLLEIRGITEEKLEDILGMEALVKSALQLLNENIPLPQMRLGQEKVVDALEAMILSNVVVSNKGNIYLPQVYTQESETACKAVKMLLEVPEPVNLAPAMERVKGRLGITLSPQQSKGVEMVFRHNLSIITGGPGTGKSTILKAVIEAYRILYPRNIIKLGAPTGKASRRMAETTGITDAQTLHSLLGLHGDESGWQKKRELDADLVIVDEASMMDMWLAYQLFTRLHPGTKLLLVGDADQLESVGAGDVFHELIDSGIVPVTVLDAIFRQAKDSPIPYNARYINQGNSDLHYGEDFAFIRADTQEETAEMIRGLYKKEAARTGIDQVLILSPFRSRGDASSDSLNEAIREEITPTGEGTPEVMFGGKLFRQHDKVMQNKNNGFVQLCDKDGEDLPPGVFNGEMGRIHEVRPGTVTVSFDGRYAGYPLESLNELELAYATTVHKAMGSECDTVIIPMLSAHKILLTRNLLYTAITRAKRRVLLVGQKKALFMAIHTSKKGKRNTLWGERMRLYCRAQTNQGVSDREGGNETMKKAS